MLNVANSSSGKNLIKVATCKDAKATAKSTIEAKREIWKDDSLQLVRDLREATRDYEKLKNGARKKCDCRRAKPTSNTPSNTKAALS